MLAYRLAERGYRVSAYDPSIDESSEIFGRISYKPSALDCVSSSDLCVIATPWPAFRRIRKSAFKGKIVIDCWRIFGGSRLEGSLRYRSGHGKARTKITYDRLSPSKAHGIERSQYAINSPCRFSSTTLRRVIGSLPTPIPSRLPGNSPCRFGVCHNGEGDLCRKPSYPPSSPGQGSNIIMLPILDP